MDKILKFRNSKLNKETNEEFYLNPRDIVINGRLNLDLLHQSDIFHYLTLNELLIILFDQSITIIDIKDSISKGLKIVKQINYENLYDKFFGKIIIDKKKIDNLIQKSFLNFQNSENSKNIKNFIVFELKSQNYSLCFFIEYENKEFVLFKLDDILDENSIQMIFKFKRDELDNLINQNLNKFIKNFSLDKNKITFENTKNDIQSVIRYVELNSKNLKNEICDLNFHLILIKINNLLCFTSFMENQINLNFEYFYDIEEDKIQILNFKAKTFKEYLIITKINCENEIFIDLFKFVFSQKNSFLEINLIKTQKIYITEDISVINYFEIENQFNLKEEKSNLMICKNNRIYIYNFNLNNLQFNHTITFQFAEMTKTVIHQSFIIQDYIFVFDSKGYFSYEKMNQKDNFIIVNKLESFDLLRDVFSVKKFNNDLGFFILGSNSVFKGNEFNICYRLPKFLQDKEMFDILSESNYKIFNQISIKNVNKFSKTFFSFCLSEFLVLFYRNKDFVIKLNFFDSEKVNSFSDDVQMNESLLILINRIKNYFSKNYKNYENNESLIEFEDFENLDSKSLLIHQFRSKLQDSIDDDNDSYEWGEFIMNLDYQCEICGDSNFCFIKYLNNKRSYACQNGHLTFSCCVTYLPLIDEKNIFYNCEECHLIYAENSLINNKNGIKIRICLVCQKVLKILQ